MTDNPYQSPNSPRTEPSGLPEVSRRVKVRALAFWFLFFFVLLGIGGRLIHHYWLGDGSDHHLRKVGLVLGALNIIGTGIPLCFGLSIIRNLRAKTS